jgi:TatD DNase family protein
LETDSPYLVPPSAGVERNEPVFVKLVAEEIARIRGVSEEEIAQTTTENARRVFHI